MNNYLYEGFYSIYIFIFYIVFILIFIIENGMKFFLIIIDISIEN